MIDKERVLQEFIELVAIPSSGRAERQIADALKRKLTEIGLAVEEDATGAKIGGNAGNLIARLPGTVAGAPCIMLSAHMDSVEPCSGIRPQRKDGVITSAGDTILGADCKSGIVPVLEALRVIQAEKMPHGEILVVFSVAEEGGLNGAKNIDPAKIRADFGYALDGSGVPGVITTMAPGQNHLQLIVHGKTAHAGLEPEAGVNAIVLAGKALAEMPQGRIDFETTCNVGLIKGGVATNIVPVRVEITVEERSRNQDKLTSLTEEIVAAFSATVEKNGGQVECQVTKKYDPYVLAEDSLVIRSAVQAAKAAGLSPVLEGSGGGSDANFFNRYGVPNAVLGTGMSKVHTKEEFIREEHLFQTTEWVLQLIKQTAHLKTT